ncbi:response regulator [Peribacillus alkalitolerans]|uniref:response regulator n=1 Tax=Peribacillus alkalitolerans TaxID=1550385 RepID=UPI0013D1EAF0|nr:response regulator transcription factor [Peribacillus alkalitolerans]
MTIKIVIADDHHIVRKGLVLFLQTQEGFTVVGEADNGQAAVEKAAALKPDLMLMDLSMPILDGIEATKLIHHQNPNIKILILTSFADQHHVIPALEAGASGYQLKDSDPDKLVHAIKAMMKGESGLDPSVTAQLLTHLQGKKSERDPVAELTSREIEVLREIASGKSNKEIASDLFITEKTVKTHVSNILSKLNLHDRTQAALFAVKQGIHKV